MNRARDLIPAALAEARRILTGAPHSAEVDLTDNCNLRCSHCYHFHGKDRHRRREFPLPEWQRRFDHLRSRGVRFLLLVGGEPALRTDAMAAACGTFPFVYAITNGTMQVPRALPIRLFVSLDGDRETNDRIRGKGVFDRVLANYADDDRAVLNMVLGRTNYTELERVVEIARDNRMRGVVCNLYTPTVGEASPQTLDPATRAAVIAELRRVKARHPRHLLLSPAMIAWYARADHRDRCYWGDEALHYDVTFTPRRCFANADCANCGCLGGAFQSPRHLLRHPFEMLRLI